METQDNGFLLVIDGVRKEKERLTAAKLFLKFHGSCLRFFNFFWNLNLFRLIEDKNSNFNVKQKNINLKRKKWILNTK